MDCFGIYTYIDVLVDNVDIFRSQRVPSFKMTGKSLVPARLGPSVSNGSGGGHSTSASWPTNTSYSSSSGRGEAGLGQVMSPTPLSAFAINMTAGMGKTAPITPPNDDEVERRLNDILVRLPVLIPSSFVAYVFPNFINFNFGTSQKFIEQLLYPSGHFFSFDVDRILTHLLHIEVQEKLSLPEKIGSEFFF